jgi:ABC-type multidrug transport system permease subunit
MNLQRILAVVAARNREFYRDKAGLGWNILMPVAMLIGFAIIFSNPVESLYKIGVLGGPDAPAEAAFFELPHLQFIPQDDEQSAIDKLRLQRLDLLVDLREPLRYWVNELSAKGNVAERLLLSSYAQQTPVLQRAVISGDAVRYVDWLVPGILGMNIMFSSLWGVGWVIVRYRKNGVLRRLRATPLKASEFLVAQIASRLIVVSAVNVLVFVGTHTLLDFPMRGSYLALVLVFVTGAIALISLGLTVAARVRSEELANGLLDLIAFPMMIVSGVWFSLEGTNVWVQHLAEFLPLTHLVDAARRIMLDGAGLADVATEITLLLVTALVLLTLSARAFRWQ